MPDSLTAFLYEWRDSIWLGMLGFAGATTNLLLYFAAGKPLNWWLVAATLLSGAMLAMTGSAIIGALAGIDVKIGGTMGLCAYITGMMGIKIALKVIAMEVGLPFGSGSGMGRGEGAPKP